MDLVGLLLIGAVLIFGSTYVAWTSWATWQEVRASAQNAQASGDAVPASTRLQHGLTLLVSLVFFSVVVSLCFSMAQGESFAEAFDQLRSLTAEDSVNGGLAWGQQGNQGVLHVTGQRVTGASLAYLQFDNSDLKPLIEQYPHIRWFILSGTQIDDRALGLLAERKNLDALVLTDTLITDAGLAALQSHRTLYELDLTRTAISDRSLEFVASLPALEHLNLRRTNVTDNGLEALEGNTTLQTLNIQETSLSDAAIATLASLPNLKALQFRDSLLSPDGIAQLQHALPECDVTLGTP